MVISDLNYLEVVSETSNVEGGQSNSSGIGQVAVANSGNNIGLFNVSAGNLAVAANVAVVKQSNKKSSFFFHW